MKNSRLLSVFFAILLVGCVSQKEMIYVQGDSDQTHQTFNNPIEQTPIKAYDELYVEVGSFDNGNMNFMNNDGGRISGGRSAADLALISYTVNQEGQINLPLIGLLAVKDLTTSQAAQTIEKELTGYLSSPTVKVSFVNKNITVLGFVKTPGRYHYVSDHINILQALGMAGDIQEYGDRKAITIIRDENGRIEKFTLDITNETILASQQFYLQSNDIVYVKPMKRRHWGVQTFPWALTLSSLTTFVLILNYIDK